MTRWIAKLWLRASDNGKISRTVERSIRGSMYQKAVYGVSVESSLPNVGINAFLMGISIQ